MKELQAVTNSLTNTGLYQLFTSSQNTLLEWIQNFGISKNNFEARPSQKQFQTEAIIEGWLVFYLSKLLLINHSEINIHLPFEYYGITSLEALRLTYAIEVWLGRRFSLELVYEYPTVKVLAQHLAQEIECVCVS